MIRNDRENIPIERNKLKYVIDVFEYVDIENPVLIKRGDEYFWTVDSTLSKPNEEENRKKFLKDWFFTSFGVKVL
jgi:hypothetical protein